jgi:feruloyl esterase
MKRLIPHLFAVSLIAAVFCAAPAIAANCEALANLSLANTTITIAKTVPAGSFTAPNAGPNNRAIENLPAFCQVHGILKPTDVSAIHFEVWLPVANWNGRAEVVGNGGSGQDPCQQQHD